MVLNKWANHGSTYILPYLPIYCFYYYVLKKIISLYDNIKVDVDFMKIIIMYLLSMSFRGNIVHEMGFCIKLILLLIIVKIILEKVIDKFKKNNLIHKI